MTTQKPDPLTPSPEAQAHIDRGVSYFREIEREERSVDVLVRDGLAAFREAIQCDPKARSAVAEAACDVGRWIYDECESYLWHLNLDKDYDDFGTQTIWSTLYETAIELAPDHIGLRLDYVDFLHFDHELISIWPGDPKVEAACRDVLRLDPDHLETRIRLGILLLPDRARLAEAEDIFRDAYARDPLRSGGNLNRRQEETLVERDAHLYAAAGSRGWKTWGHALAYEMFIHSLLVQDKTSDAVQVGRDAIRLYPHDDSGRPYYALGTALLQHGSHDEAIETYNKGLRRESTDDNRAKQIDVLWELADGLCATGAPDKGDDIYQEVIAAYRLARHSYKEFLAANDAWSQKDFIESGEREAYDQFEEELKRLAQHNKSDDLPTRLCHRDRFSDAVSVYREWIAEGGAVMEVYLSLGALLEQQGDRVAAIQIYQDGARVDPKDSRPYNGLGRIYYADGKLDAAFDAHAKAQVLYSDWCESWNDDYDEDTGRHRLFDLAIATGRLDEARQAFFSLTGASGFESRLYYILVLLLQQRVADAVMVLRELLWTKARFDADQLSEQGHEPLTDMWCALQAGNVPEALAAGLRFANEDVDTNLDKDYWEQDDLPTSGLCTPGTGRSQRANRQTMARVGPVLRHSGRHCDAQCVALRSAGGNSRRASCEGIQRGGWSAGNARAQVLHRPRCATGRCKSGALVSHGSRTERHVSPNNPRCNERGRAVGGPRYYRQ
jgi:tetratricopeptide (TPR) repeat protein